MVKIYVELDTENFIIGYGNAEYGPITINPKDSILIKVDNNHDILEGKLAGWRILNGTLVKDDSKIVRRTKESKKQELSETCESHILNGFDYKIKDTIYHFSYDREAQLNLQETFQMFQNDMLKSIVWTVRLNGEHTRITLDKETFNKIYTKSLQHKHDAISRLRDVLNPILEQLQSVEQIEALKWDSQVNFPLDPSVTLKEDNTIDVQIDGVNKKTENLAMENEMLTMAILEVANSAMGGGK